MENFVMAYAQQLSNALEKGEKVYQDILSLREDGADYVICPEHIGDSIWIAAFIADYKATHDCEKVYLVGKDSQVEIIGRFPEVDGTVAITTEEMLNLRRYIYYTDNYDKNHIVFAHFKSVFFLNADGFFVQHLPDERMVGDMISTRKHMLGIPDEYEARPNRMLLFDDGKDEDLKQMFSNAILFCPTMQTQEGYLPDELFETLAKRYTDADYKCYTNYNGFDYERMIAETTPLASSLSEFSVIAPYFKQVIAVRSGACDLLAQTDANLSVIYHSRDVGNANHIVASPDEIGRMTIFGLIQREHVAEYVYVEGREKEFYDAVFAQLEG